MINYKHFREVKSTVGIRKNASWLKVQKKNSSVHHNSPYSNLSLSLLSTTTTTFCSRQRTRTRQKPLLSTVCLTLPTDPLTSNVWILIITARKWNAREEENRSFWAGIKSNQNFKNLKQTHKKKRVKTRELVREFW